MYPRVQCAYWRTHTLRIQMFVASQGSQKTLKHESIIVYSYFVYTVVLWFRLYECYISVITQIITKKHTEELHIINAHCGRANHKVYL